MRLYYPRYRRSSDLNGGPPIYIYIYIHTHICTYSMYVYIYIIYIYTHIFGTPVAHYILVTGDPRAGVGFRVQGLRIREPQKIKDF